jgi:hypothetical protein
MVGILSTVTGSFKPANGENSTESDKARVTNDNLRQINS